MPMRTLVIVPTYNEAGNIEAALGRLHSAAPGVDVLVVDDNSPDGTGRIADELAQKDTRISVLHRTGKGGLGPAYIAGFKEAIARGYDLVVEMDADGSHPADALPRMLARMNDSAGTDLAGVIGSRWVPGGSVVNWPTSRKIISRGGSLYARIMLGLPTKDVTAGYRVYRTDLLESIGIDDVASHGYCFQIDLTRRFLGAGYRLVEEPIEFREREIGESKMSRSIVVEAMTMVTRWGFQRMTGVFRRPSTEVAEH